MHIQADTMDDVQCQVLQHILSYGRRVQPRGTWVTEITGASFQLLQPRARLIYSPKRAMNLSFAIGELLWYLRGSDNVQIVSFYNKRYKSFSDDGETLYGAYGKRVFTSDTGINQWEAVLNLLKADKDTRQAVIHFHLPRDLTVVSHDIPCTCTMQFFIRDNKLEAIVTMRSNDIIWGTPYDVFSFTMMQEIMAKELALDLGTYTHFVGSLHLYDRHISLAHKILHEPTYHTYCMSEMPLTPWPNISQLLCIEEHLRVNGGMGIDANFQREPYWKDFAWILQSYVTWKERRDVLPGILQQLPPHYATLLQTQFQRQK